MKIFFFKNIRSISSATALFFPFLLHAQGLLSGGSFSSAVGEAISLIYLAIPILLLLAVGLFFWGVGKFVLKPGSSADVENGKKYMFWGIITLFVLLSVRVIIGQLANALGIGPLNPDEWSLLLPSNIQGSNPP